METQQWRLSCMRICDKMSVYEMKWIAVYLTLLQTWRFFISIHIYVRRDINKSTLFQLLSCGLLVISLKTFRSAITVSSCHVTLQTLSPIWLVLLRHVVVARERISLSRCTYASIYGSWPAVDSYPGCQKNTILTPTGVWDIEDPWLLPFKEVDDDPR